MPALAVNRAQKIARPLKILVPLIKVELEAGDRAGLEHYIRAGDMLIEAKEQMPYGNWGRWLAHNFKAADGSKMSATTAQRWMRLAEMAQRDPEVASRADVTARELLRPNEGDPRTRAHSSWRPVLKAARDLDADLFAQEKQTRDDEVKLHRELAIEFVNMGYRAMATRLHPDRGGSKDAMVRLNRIRDAFKAYAETRRFV